MTKLTIAQEREKALDRLVALKTDNPTGTDYQEAKKLMTSFYRLYNLAKRNFNYANNTRYYKTKQAIESNEKEKRWFKRLNQAFKPYGLMLDYPGAYPEIYYIGKEGSPQAQAFLTYYYN